MRSIAILAITLGVAQGALADLDEALFANPPKEVRPWTYWLWQNGNVEPRDVTALAVIRVR